MNEFINKIELQGIVGRVSKSGDYTDFSLVTERTYECNGENVVDVTWFQCRGMCDVEKGQWVKVTGYVKVIRYSTEEGDRQSWQVIATIVEIL